MGYYDIFFYRDMHQGLKQCTAKKTFIVRSVVDGEKPLLFCTCALSVVPFDAVAQVLVPVQLQTPR
jgi:hypothetical protein